MSDLPAIEHHPGFTLIRIGGDPYRRGLQHGRLLGDGVRRLRDIFYRDVVDLHGRPLGLALRGIMAPILLAMYRHIPRELRLEMRGVAAGAGVSFWDVLTFNCFDDLLHSLWLLPPLLSKVPFVGNRFACSSFALLAERTLDGRLLHGRNLDYEVANGYLAGDGAVTRALLQNVVVIDCRPSTGRPFLSVGWPGVVGVVTSLNAAGLSLACLTSTLTGETPNGIPLPLLYRQISQYASSLDQAERLIRGARLTIGNNLLVASAAENDARVFELSPRHVATRSPRDGALVTTNHFAHDEMIPHQNGWVVPSSVNRHSRLDSLCASGPATREQAAEFLLDTVCPDPAAADDPWSCLRNPGTIYSTLTEPATARVWVRTYDQPDRSYVELQGSWAVRRAAVPA